MVNTRALNINLSVRADLLGIYFVDNMVGWSTYPAPENISHKEGIYTDTKF